MNDIPVFAWKKVGHVLSRLLSELSNESVSTRTFPDQLRLGRNFPLHKPGPKTVLIFPCINQD